MKEINCKIIILEWMKEKNPITCFHHNIEKEVQEYGLEKFGKMYSYATYHRNFCWIKNDEKLLRENGIEITPLIEGSGKLNKWRITLIV